MILKALSPNHEEFLKSMNYFGVALSSDPGKVKRKYNDIEEFFVLGTLNMKSSRVTEGFLCWLLQYGHLVSPSKVRRLIDKGQEYNPAVLGAFLFFLKDHNIQKHQWKILQKYARKSKELSLLFKGPRPQKTNKYFYKYNLLTYDYQINTEKFLVPISQAYKKCIELKNRALFGSVVHADVASFLKFNKKATAYQIFKATGHHKASVFKVYTDVKAAG